MAPAGRISALARIPQRSSVPRAAALPPWKLPCTPSRARAGASEPARSAWFSALRATPLLRTARSFAVAPRDAAPLPPHAGAGTGAGDDASRGASRTATPQSVGDSADGGGADGGGSTAVPVPRSPSPLRGSGSSSGSSGARLESPLPLPPARDVGGGSGGGGGGGSSRAWAWWDTYGRHPLTAALVGGALTAVAAAVGYLYVAREKLSQVQVAAQFHSRRLEAVKARILHGPGLAASSAPAGGVLQRPNALKVLDGLDADAGLYMLVAPKGEGKSTLVAQWAATRPHVILVDVGTSEDLNDAVRAVAAALAYDMQYSEGERAAVAAGFTLPNLSGPQGEALFLELLRVYGVACEQLAAAGALRGRYSALILDQATRPLYGPAGRTGGSPLHGGNLIYATVNYGHYFANKHVATLALVSSDPLMETDGVWRKASGRDSLRFRRIPAFSEEEAAELLARRVFAGLSADQRIDLLGSTSAVAAADGSPTPEQLTAVKGKYSTSIAFVVAAVGTRARWLAQLLGNENAATLLSNEDLPTRGLRVPEADLPFLPSAFAADERVDAGVLHSFEGLVEERRKALRTVLTLPFTFSLSPQASVPPSPENLEAERILATYAALRWLLSSSAPVKYEDVCDAHFSARDGDLLRLGEAHIVFYNHDGKTLELESELMRRVVAARLDSAQHRATVELARALLAWQQASTTAAMAKENVDRWKGGAPSHEKTQEEMAAQTALTAAQRVVVDLRATIDKLRGEIAAQAAQRAKGEVTGAEVAGKGALRVPGP